MSEQQWDVEKLQIRIFLIFQSWWADRKQWLTVDQWRSTSGLVLQPLDGLQQILLLIQLALQEGISLDHLVHPLLKVLQGHDGRPEIQSALTAVKILSEQDERGEMWPHTLLAVTSDLLVLSRSSLACSSSRMYLWSWSLMAVLSASSTSRPEICRYVSECCASYFSWSRIWTKWHIINNKNPENA